VESVAAAAPRTSEEAFDKAAAAGFLMWRDAAAARLRSLGVTVIDAAPGRLAAAVADEYLRVKAAGRL
jgi:hypothetical protein